MFGLPLFMLMGFLVVRWTALWRSLPAGMARLKAVWSAVYVFIGLVIVASGAMLVLLVSMFLTTRGRDFLEGIRNNDAVRQVIGDRPWGNLVLQFMARRLAEPWTVLLLALLLAAVVVVLWNAVRQTGVERAEQESTAAHTARDYDASNKFALWIALIGLTLTFSVEFVYLRDTFGTRMNTVFKFYYQAWVLFSLSGVYGVYCVLRGKSSRPVWRGFWVGGLALLLAATSVYPIMAGYSKADGFQGVPTLDGTAYMARYNPDDHAAIQWLNQNVTGAPVILEASGGSYSQFGRVSSQTGLPTVLGWGGHELQWRGNYEEAGKREPDIDQMYSSFDPKLTLTLLDKYGISYVYVGSLERQKYSPSALSKFDRLLDVAYRNSSVTIYRRQR
jgi:YYY domain-containing protein